MGAGAIVQQDGSRRAVPRGVFCATALFRAFDLVLSGAH